MQIILLRVLLKNAMVKEGLLARVCTNSILGGLSYGDRSIIAFEY